MPDYQLRAYEILSEEQAKRWLRINETDSDLMRQLIMAATDRVESYCQRPIVARNRTEYYDGQGLLCLQLRYYPVVTLVSVDNLDDNGVVLKSFNVSQPAGDLWLNAERGELESKLTSFEWGPRSVKVVYAPGWTTPPRDVELAAQMLLGRWWREWQNARDDIQSVSVDGQTLTFDTTGMPPRVAALLDPYVAVSAGSAAAYDTGGVW